MGLIQFNVDSNDFIVQSEISKADFVTFDGRVIAAQCQFNDGLLSCYRGQTDSSKLRILCNLNGRQLIIQTTSLRENQFVYSLETELARGELARLRNFYSLWTGAGLKSTEELDRTIHLAHEAFRGSIFADDSSAAAIKSIQLTQDAIDLLVLVYTSQRIAYRTQRTSRIPMFVGCRLISPPESEDEFLKAFNAIIVRTRWDIVEPNDGDYQWEQLDALVDWAVQLNLFIMGGPLLDLSSTCFPGWIMSWKSDLVNLQSFTADFVETVVGRYVGRIRHWEIVCGANCGGENELSEEQRLNLIIRAAEAAQAVDEQIQISLRVIQPWGEYLSTTENRLPPIQFVDTLRRSGASLAEINLDLRFGNGEIHSLQRDMLYVSQLLDHWSLLQLPINVMVALPERCRDNDDVAELVAWQSDIIEDLMLMCLSKERVSGFFCLNWNDSSVMDATLVGANQSIHPVVKRIAQIWDEN
ncbi:MAG: endo-1,4-beta-xylanase [Fuerstiella sp.]